ncbi:MAG: peptidoglycan-binding protein [Micavibrio aeruginosavorus]|uniref:Peptidoglycan-binding protein n=1 Tax=Micavibrio aeruginosavorus TaxID=349221 RepID=A0A2W5MYZ7_9BACT|nr:MAG: peptidoglycan-binding protein [Micavibrio aeruginosavorus]
MRKYPAAFTLATLLLSGCLTPTGTQKPADVVSYGIKGGAGTTGMHTVLQGDTVYTVSQKYNLPLREIITLNHLSAPYYLNLGYRLKLPPPNDYKVRPGDTLNGISRIFGVSVSETARVNNLSPPYILASGRTIRLPTSQPELKNEFAVNPAPPSFETVSGPITVPRVESEVLKPPAVASASSVKSAPVASASAYPPQPTAKTASGVLVAPSPEPAPVQKVSAATPSVAPKVPARAGSKFMRPVDGKILSGYGPKDGGLHNDGINIKASRGTSVRAADNGVVAYTGSDMQGYGNLVLIRHADRWMTAYAHMDKTLVRKGDVVKAGQSIGTVGSTGGVDSPQLHFEVRKGTEAMNPERYL